ncbi:MAG: hypothetical protein ACI808_001641 [Paraglaciecola sp.]|jgi:hypothetical protein
MFGPVWEYQVLNGIGFDFRYQKYDFVETDTDDVG